MFLFGARFVWIHKVPNGSSNRRLGSGFAAKTPSTPIKILGDHARYAIDMSWVDSALNGDRWPCCKTMSIPRDWLPYSFGHKVPTQTPITQWYWTMNKQLKTKRRVGTWGNLVTGQRLESKWILAYSHFFDVETGGMKYGLVRSGEHGPCNCWFTQSERTWAVFVQDKECLVVLNGDGRTSSDCHRKLFRKFEAEIEWEL